MHIKRVRSSTPNAGMLPTVTKRVVRRRTSAEEKSPSSPLPPRSRSRSTYIEDTDLSGRTFYMIDWSLDLPRKFNLYMMLSYLYYERCVSMVPDSDYDRLCVEIGEGWSSFEHPHKHLVTKEDMDATTGYAIKFPLIVKLASQIMCEKHLERR